MAENKLTVTKRQSDEYSLRWSNGDWIVAHVSEATGVFSISSTWGSWSHRWNLLHLPSPRLGKFLSARPFDFYYFAKKLVPLNRQSAIDIAASRREMKRQLCERRRRKLVGSDDARDCWYEIEEWDGGWLPTGMDASSVAEVLTQEWTDLTERVLPVLLEAIAGEARKA